MDRDQMDEMWGKMLATLRGDPGHEFCGYEPSAQREMIFRAAMFAVFTLNTIAKSEVSPEKVKRMFQIFREEIDKDEGEDWKGG